MVMAESKSILIAGAGIAGPALALLLSRAGHKCTIVERADDFRSAGQQVDIRGEGFKIIRIMGIEDAIRKRKVQDDGLKFVDGDDQIVAKFPVEAADGPQGFVSEIEILRPDLAGILYEQTKARVEYIFGDYITDIRQHKAGASVKFANSTTDKEFDIVVAADGLRSRTRNLAFDPENTEVISLKQFAVFFDVVWQASDDTWSRWYNAPSGRCVCLRPNKSNNTTGAYLCQVTDESGKLPQMSSEEQREEIIKLFQDAGWETPRILEELKSASTGRFYVQEVAQAKSSSFVNGRVALLGDAGYCPSPVSGQGTTLALVGAYILAGCILTYSDYQTALSQYEKEMRPFVESAQKLPPGVPWIVNPQSKTGITVLNSVLWAAGIAINSRIASVLGKVGEWLPSFSSNHLQMPSYPALDGAQVNGKDTKE